MTTEETIKFISETIQKSLRKSIGQTIEEVSLETIRDQVHDSFKRFVDSMFVVHHIDFKEHVDLVVTLDEKERTLFHITMTPKTKTGTAILLEWHRRASRV